MSLVSSQLSVVGREVLMSDGRVSKFKEQLTTGY
jgi:hypothetical protein